MKKNAFFVLGTAALALVFGLALAGCPTGMTGLTVAVTGSTTTPDLPGDVTISPNGSAAIGEELTANYSGSETVTWLWKRGGTYIADGQTYTPTMAGSYTVTANAAGYNSKTSAAVTVTAPALTGTVAITGTAQVGETLTATVSDSNGTGTPMYQWIRGGSSTPTAIEGAYQDTYVPVDADVGSVIWVMVYYEGFSNALASDPTAVVVAAGSPPVVSFEGTWNGTDAYSAMTYVFTGADYLLKNSGQDEERGTFTFTDTEITLTTTGTWDGSDWNETSGEYAYGYTLSGDTLSFGGGTYIREE